MRYGISHLAGFDFGRRLLNPYLNELGRAFTITHDRVRKLARDFVQCIGKRRERRSVLRLNPHGTATGRDHHERIVGRCVAVDRDAIERSIGCTLRQPLQQCRRNRGVCCDETEHRGHVRADHPRAFGDACERDSGSGRIDSARRSLRHRVGRHDCLRRLQPVILPKPPERLGQSCDQAPDRQLLHDHAG